MTMEKNSTFLLEFVVRMKYKVLDAAILGSQCVIDKLSEARILNY